MSQKIEGNAPVGAAVRSTATRSVSSSESGSGSSSAKSVSSTDTADRVSLTGEATQLQSLQRGLQKGSGIDEARVQSVKDSLNNGSYKINDDTIANRMLTLDQQLAG